MGPSLCCASVNFLSLGALFFHRNQISLLFSWVAAAELNWSEHNGANAFQWTNLILNIWFHQRTIESLQNSLWNWHYTAEWIKTREFHYFFNLSQNLIAILCWFTCFAQVANVILFCQFTNEKTKTISCSWFVKKQ